MTLELSISPHGQLLLYDVGAPGEAPPAQATEKRITAAFGESAAHGLLHLATGALQAGLSPSLDYVRQLARLYLTRLCQTQGGEAADLPDRLPPPAEGELQQFLLQAPPMPGQEYLTPDVLTAWWVALDELVHREISRHSGGPAAYLAQKNPQWRFVGRVMFHLAENKRNAELPFAFMATYISRLSAQGREQHEPLARAIQRLSQDKNRAALLTALAPVRNATEASDLARQLVDSGDVYHPQAWTPREAYQFLQEIPALEASGLIVRVPDWWKGNRPPRAVVSVNVGEKRGAGLGAGELLDFSVGVALDGEPLTAAEIEALLDSVDGLAPIKGQWVEVDRDRLVEALEHWKEVERRSREGLSFFEGMRLLAGAPLGRDAGATTSPAIQAWTGLSAGATLEATLAKLRSPESLIEARPAGLHAELRPYQRMGAAWLRFLTRLGLGALLADDMGLGKTIQVIALLLDIRHAGGGGPPALPSLLVAPASLIGNWKAELARFAPTLAVLVVHPSETPPGAAAPTAADAAGRDLVMTTYGMATRIAWLAERKWNLVILDEAQAIKNAATRQTKAVKELQAAARIALTGTPVENRLGDLWSLFDFLNPGLLGAAKTFGEFVKRLGAQGSYQPLRTLIQPYILRRLKTDKRVIADLPDKTEVVAYCALSRKQAALYEQAVRDLEQRLIQAEGIQRRGLVLAQLMRLKQICNHPSHWLGDEDYAPDHSGKFQRLAALCEELAERQEKALVFTQFRELTEPLARFLQTVFGRAGQVLHGGTSVAKRRQLVESFQRDDGPPFFVLSLKAGGTGLNLTAAAHVIHFDRWWNPAVEQQATDRAFRIGQKKNVLVHKFVCRGTLEEKIDALIAHKSGLAQEVLEGAEALLTEMDDDQLLQFVALDVNKALDA